MCVGVRAHVCVCVCVCVCVWALGKVGVARPLIVFQSNLSMLAQSYCGGSTLSLKISCMQIAVNRAVKINMLLSVSSIPVVAEKHSHVLSIPKCHE